MASISPDGLTVAFVGQYEGSDRGGVMNVFSMDLEGRDVNKRATGMASTSPAQMATCSSKRFWIY